MMSDIGNLVGELRLQGSRLSHRAADAIESLAAHDAEVAAKAVSDLAEQLVEREMPEQGAHINTTSYREGLVDGVNRAVIAAQRRAAEYRKAVQ